MEPELNHHKLSSEAESPRPIYSNIRMPSVDPQLSPSTKLWRYIPLEDFLWTVVTKKLHFPKVTRFQDAFEGALTERELEYESELRLTNPDEFEKRQKTRDWNRETLFVSCWHTSDFESEFMWRLYGRKSGICMQSTLERIKGSIQSLKSEEPLIISPVRYVNFESEEAHEKPDSLAIFFRKHLSFAPENEIRIVQSCRSTAEKTEGVDLDVDLDKLIENLYISPLLRQNIKQIVEALVRKFDFSFPIQHSVLTRAAKS